MLQLLTKPYLCGCSVGDWLLGISFSLAGSHCAQLSALPPQFRHLTYPVFRSIGAGREAAGTKPEPGHSDVQDMHLDCPAPSSSPSLAEPLRSSRSARPAATPAGSARAPPRSPPRPRTTVTRRIEPAGSTRLRPVSGRPAWTASPPSRPHQSCSPLPPLYPPSLSPPHSSAGPGSSVARTMALRTCGAGPDIGMPRVVATTRAGCSGSPSSRSTWQATAATR